MLNYDMYGSPFDDEPDFSEEEEFYDSHHPETHAPPRPQTRSVKIRPPLPRQRERTRKTPAEQNEGPPVKFTSKELENASRHICQHNLVFEDGEGKTGESPYDKRCIQRDNAFYLQIRKWEAEALELCGIPLERFCVQNPDGMSVYQNTFSNYYTEGCDLRALLVTSGFASRHPKTAEQVFEQIQDVIMRLWHDGLSNRMSEIITKEKTLTWDSHLKSHKTAGS